MRAAEVRVLKEALSLPAKQRARVAATLIDSLDAETEAAFDVAWREEVQRRVRELEDGTVKAIPWDEARAAIFD